MPICYQLIGVPGSGKTTWTDKKFQKDFEQHTHVYVSTDIWIERHAESKGKTYNEVFDHFMPSAVRLMTQSVIRAKNNNRHIVWDQTSTTVASRRKKFNLLPDYEHVAVVFQTPEPEELKRRLLARPGKNIPQNALDRMIFNLHNEPVSLSEGFSNIIFV